MHFPWRWCHTKNMHISHKCTLRNGRELYCTVAICAYARSPWGQSGKKDIRRKPFLGLNRVHLLKVHTFDMQKRAWSSQVAIQTHIYKYVGRWTNRNCILMFRCRRPQTLHPFCWSPAQNENVLTAGELKTTVDEDGVASGGPRAEDPALLHHHLRIQGPPWSRTLLLKSRFKTTTLFFSFGILFGHPGGWTSKLRSR